MLFSEKLTFIIISMIIIILIIFSNIILEVFFIMFLIGIIILRELIETFAPDDLKDRINLFVYIGLIIFIVIIIDRIRNIISHI